MPHPKGDIQVDLKRKGKAGISGSVILPDGLQGEFIWHNKKIKLSGGYNEL
jgi:alpha-L-rhamnosidase